MPSPLLDLLKFAPDFLGFLFVMAPVEVTDKRLSSLVLVIPVIRSVLTFNTITK